MNFYIYKNQNNLNILNANDFEELILLFNENKFDNFNKEYSEEVNYEPDIIIMSDELDSESSLYFDN